MTAARSASSAIEAPVTLDQPPAKLHGFLDQFGLWSNFGISLLVPVVVTFFVHTSYQKPHASTPHLCYCQSSLALPFLVLRVLFMVR